MFSDFGIYHLIAVIAICACASELYTEHNKTELQIAAMAHGCAAPASAASAP